MCACLWVNVPVWMCMCVSAIVRMCVLVSSVAVDTRVTLSIADWWMTNGATIHAPSSPYQMLLFIGPHAPTTSHQCVRSAVAKASKRALFNIFISTLQGERQAADVSCAWQAWSFKEGKHVGLMFLFKKVIRPLFPNCRTGLGKPLMEISPCLKNWVEWWMNLRISWISSSRMILSNIFSLKKRKSNVISLSYLRTWRPR